jgi:hypothetical protein
MASAVQFVSPMRVLSSILFPLWAAERAIVVLDSYFDEGGSGKRCVLVVSALVSTSSAMNKLGRDWKAILKDFGVPYWHTVDFRHLKPELFRHLSQSKRKKLLTALVREINRRSLMGVTAIINTEEYVKLTTPRFRSQWGAAYTFAVQMCLVEISLHLPKIQRNKECFNVLLEEGHQNAAQTLEHLRRMKEIAAPRILNICDYGLGGKKQNPVLQAADMLAYSSYEHHRALKRRPEIFGRLVAVGKSGMTYREIPCDKVHIELAKRGVETLFKQKRLGDLVAPTRR